MAPSDLDRRVADITVASQDRLTIESIELIPLIVRSAESTAAATTA